MEQQIINFIKNKNNVHIDIENEDSIKKIYELLINDIIYDPINIIENYYLGWYYCKVKQEYDLMKKHYLICIEHNDNNAMNNLGCYYMNIEKNYDLTKKYYLMAADNVHTRSIHNLGVYYHNIEKNYDLMKKYYSIAIDKNYISSMYNLALYYKNIEKNYDLMKKYYLMAIEQNNVDSMLNLGYYYQTIEPNYDLMKKYYYMAIDNNDTNSLNNFMIYYDNYDLPIDKLEFFIKYIDKIKRSKIINIINDIAKIKLNKEDNKKFIDIIVNFEYKDEDNISSLVRNFVEIFKYKISITKLHFEYSLEGKGFEEAKEDFYNKII
jgi:hypothetical protein